MKILFVIDYPSWRRIKSGEQPSHHLFGLYQMIDSFISEDTAILKNNLGEVDFLCFNERSLKAFLTFYIKSFKYDVVYDSICSISKIFGVLNKWHLFRPRLVTIFHHPPFGKVMKHAKSDVSIFFTDRLLREAKKEIADNRIMMTNRWYPDVEWYVKNSVSLDKTKTYDFLDNGKTARDHNKFITSLLRLGENKGIIVTDKAHVPENYTDGGNVELYFQDKPNDRTMLSLSLHSKVMVIPLIGTKDMLGPIGNTSYMDALALGMPIVAPSNAAFAQEIRDNNLGVLYDPLNENFSAELKMSLLNYEELSQNVRTFAKKHTIKEYSENLQRILFN